MGQLATKGRVSRGPACARALISSPIYTAGASVHSLVYVTNID